MLRLSYMVLDRAALQPAARLRETLGLLADLGYRGVELNLAEPPGMDLDLLQTLLRDCGLAVSAFLSGEAYAQGLCLSSPEAQVRARTVERLVRYLDTARCFDALLVVGLLQGLRRDEPDEAPAQERIAEGLRRVAGAAEERGVTVVMEPVNHLQVGFNNSVAEVGDLVRRVGSPAVQPMVDTLHLNIEERSVVGAIHELGATVRHVHLCESNGGPFGSGNVDFAAVWRALAEEGYDGWGTVKVYRKATVQGGARSAMEHLRRRGLV